MILHMFCLQVDTVNDSHMVASGVPEKNGDKHAPEIATMALDLLVRKIKFKVKSNLGYFRAPQQSWEFSTDLVREFS